jgi:dnd system-associated protein 4
MQSFGTKRIHRARDKEDIIAAWTSEQGVFGEIWRLLLFAAQVGFHERIDSGKGIDQSTFGNCRSWPGFSYLLSLVESNSSEVLTGTSNAEELRIAIFQEYANGGLSIMKEFFHDRQIDLDGLIAFIEERFGRETQNVNLDLAI